MGNVYSITLCDRDLHHVPDDIYKHHKHVAKLLLRRNNIQEIPPDIRVLTNLLELSLRDNLLSSVPVEVIYSVVLLDVRCDKSGALDSINKNAAQRPQGRHITYIRC